MEKNCHSALEDPLGRSHLRRRMAVEMRHEEKFLGRGLHLFHVDNWYSVHSFIRNSLRLVGLYRRAKRNAEQIALKRNILSFSNLPSRFDGYTILHLSDLHVDMNERAMEHLIELIKDLDYDLCVLTGDYRGKIYGSCEAALDGMARLRSHLKAPAFAVLGNHDALDMVYALEDIGIRILLNESHLIERGGQQLYLAGIDDAHHYETGDIEKAKSQIPSGAFSILLSHTPAIYAEAAKASFSLTLSGHTHGGQICLPGSVPVKLEAGVPRPLAAGSWKYQDMQGYTSVGAGSSVVAVRLNCPPEITLHHLRQA